LRSHTFYQSELTEASSVELDQGSITVYTRRAPGKSTPNEDSCAMYELSDGTVVMAIADGAGGYYGGEKASRILLESLGESLERWNPKKGSVRTAILDAIELGNSQILSSGMGSATTFICGVIERGMARLISVGDSPGFVFGGKGKIKKKTTMQSPVGYALASGLYSETQAKDNHNFHLVSNLVGFKDLSVEYTVPLCLSPRDKVLICSDGLSDNIDSDQMIDAFLSGDLSKNTDELVQNALVHMENPKVQSHHPDDCSLMVFKSNSSSGGDA
jgi:protein phosphatase